MKYSFSLFFLILNLIVKGQSYTSFTFPNSIWRDYIYTGNPIFSSLYEYNVYDYEYYTCGDTIGEKYFKLYKVGYYHDINRNWMLNTITHDSTFSCSYFGAIRSDSLKKVYFLPADSSTEKLLYDFDLQIGDTLPLTYIYTTYQFSINIVKSIDSVLIALIYKVHIIVFL
jgi:hypothetical protein